MDLIREKVELGEDLREIYGFDTTVEEHSREEHLQRIHPKDRIKIQEVGEKLQQRFCKDRGFLARYHGDQFALVVRDVKGSMEGQKVAEEILDLFIPQFSVGLYALNVNVSMGFSTSPEDGRNEDELIKNSNIALT